MKLKILFCLALAGMLALPCFSAEETISYKVSKVWDNGKYCAFTSLLKYKGRYYLAFREGESHIFDSQGKAEGKIRILSSKNGKSWTSVALFGKPGMDFRDPKLSIAPDGRLMVDIGVSIYVNKVLKGQIPHVCFSQNGTDFTEAVPCHLDRKHTNDWCWRTTWHNGTGYTVNYFSSSNGEKGLSLLSTTDGINYSTVTDLPIPDFPGESTIRFLPDGRMLMCVRREAGNCKGYWGISEAPYTKWKFREMEFHLGGPNFILLPNGTAILGSRNYAIGSACKTSLYVGNPLTGRFTETCVLPSGDDTSYTGLLVEGKELWVSYYSAEPEGHGCIYLAKLPLSMFKYVPSKQENSYYNLFKELVP